MTKEMTEMSIRQHDFTIERRFRQTPAQAYQAFAHPELKARWFGASDTWTEQQRAIDFRVGGSERIAARIRHSAATTSVCSSARRSRA